MRGSITITADDNIIVISSAISAWRAVVLHIEHVESYGDLCLRVEELDAAFDGIPWYIESTGVGDILYDKLNVRDKRKVARIRNMRAELEDNTRAAIDQCYGDPIPHGVE